MTVNDVVSLLDRINMTRYIIEDLANDDVETILILDCLTEILMLEKALDEASASVLAIETLTALMNGVEVWV
jgi:hypothetical protein